MGLNLAVKGLSFVYVVCVCVCIPQLSVKEGYE